MSRAKTRAKVAELFDYHWSRLEVYLRLRLENPEDAAELAQETYLRMLLVKRADSIRQPEAYLFRIARSVLYEFYKKPGVSSDASINPDQLESEDPSPYDLAVLAWRREAVERAMKELSPKCQAALLLRWREDLTQAEIAKRMDLSRPMVQKYLAKGIAHCRSRLQRRTAR